jgi:hypothetical protein
MSEGGFFSRIFGGSANEDETRVFSPQELQRKEPSQGEPAREEPAREEPAREKPGREEPEEEQRGGFTVERAVGIIDDLPPDVPRESARRIVHGTLTAAGVRVEDLERSTRTREAKLDSEIERARSRQRELQERTDETVRSLEEEIRRTHEVRESGLAEEEERISRASVGLENIKRVRAFFGFPKVEEDRLAEPADKLPASEPPAEETRVFEPFDDDRTQVLRRPNLPDGINEPGGAPSQDLSPYRDPYGTTER